MVRLCTIPKPITGDYMKYTSPIPGKRSKILIKRDKNVMFSANTRSNELPLTVKNAKGCKIYDLDGNEYIDFGAGYAVCATGHCHEDVIKAAYEQLQKLIHISGSDFYYESQITLAERLFNVTPGKFNKRVYFGNSGAESLEAAFKISRYYTRRPRVISFIGSFHGRTFVGMSLTGSKMVQKSHFSPLIPEVIHTLYPYCYRCPLNLTYPECIRGEFEGIPLISCVNYLLDTVFEQLCDPLDVAAIFVEPVQGEGGYIVPPKEFLPLLAAIARKWGIVLIVDEIQSGLGRTGRWFASDHFGVEPDIICIAKALASGLPISATVGRAEFMDNSVDDRAWVEGSHGSTFGGNPVSCAVGIKTIELLGTKLIKNSEVVGNFMKERLQDMQKRHKIIGDVRGLGLMLGVEFVKDRETKEMFPLDLDGHGKGIKQIIMGSCFQKGLIVLGCGRNSIRFSPPLIITKEEALKGLQIFEEVIKEIETALGF